MANIVAIEPSLFRPDEEAWFIFDNGRKCLRKLPKDEPDNSSNFPCPMIRKDSIEPCRSMANGKMYDSLSGLRSSYKAENNPYRENFTEVGDAEIKYQAPDFDRKQRREDIKRALHDVKSGNVPPDIQAIQ